MNYICVLLNLIKFVQTLKTGQVEIPQNYVAHGTEIVNIVC